MPDNSRQATASRGPWPEPRLRAMEVEEVYRFAPMATGYSYFGALLTLGVLIESGDIGRGAVWFLWATAVTFYRSTCIVAYRRRTLGSDAQYWGRLMVAGNFLSGVQWGVLGTLLFPSGPVFLQLFTLMVIVCYVAGSVTAWSAVKGAHDALSLPATIPTAVYLFFLRDGAHWYAGVMALFFSFAVLYYSRKLHRHLEEGFRLQIERDDLLTLTGMLNEKLARENRDLAHRAAVRGVSVESARGRAERLEALFQRSALPQVECDAAGSVVASNPAAERLFGLRRDELVGVSLTALLALPESDMKSLASAAHAEVFEVEARGRDGTRVSCRASFTPLPDGEGEPHGFGVTLTGIPVIVA
ncbi:MAG TPA: PAS domain-containing protein [Usitatibacter sp.]|nr:PAS domain-containing protein [Usitatibacter sp.]